MSGGQSSTDAETGVVAITEDGQTTIPKRFLDTLGIDPPERIRFRAVGDGKLVVERVRSASELQGFTERSEASADTPATELLREKRSRDSVDRDARFSPDR